MQKFSVLACMDATTGIETDPESVFDLYRINEDFSLIRIADGRRFTDLSPPLPCIVLLGWSEESMAFLEAVQAKFVEQQGTIIPDIVILEQEPTWEGVLAAAFYGFEYFLTEQSRHVVELSRDLASLRRQHETILSNFHAVEQFFLDRKVKPIEEAFVNEARVRFDFPRRSSGKGRLPVRQKMPTATAHLSAFALHVAETDPAANGRLNLALHCPELDETLWRWSIPLGQMPLGWVLFGLPRSRGDLPKTAVLDLAVEGAIGGFRLSAGEVNPLPDYRLMTSEGTPAGERSLALRTFISPPGIAIPHDELTVMPLGQDERVPPTPDFASLRLHSVAMSELADVRSLPMQDGGEGNERMVFHRPAEGCIDIRLTGPEASAAILPACLPEGTIAVSAEVTIRSPRSGIVGFRIGAVSGNALVGAAHLRGKTDSYRDYLELSDWVFVGPARRQSLSVRFRHPLKTPDNAIVLVARMKEGSAATPEEFASFGHIRFEIE